MLQTHRPSNSNICCREMQDVFACTYAYTCASIFIRVWTVLVFWHILQAILERILFVNKRTPLLALAFSQFAFKDRMAAMEKHSQAFFKACWFWDMDISKVPQVLRPRRHGVEEGAWCTPPQLLVSCLCQLPCPIELTSGRQWHLGSSSRAA